VNLINDESIAAWNERREYDEAELDRRDAEFLEVVPSRIAEETAVVRERIAAGATYVVNGERNLVHDHSCPSLRHQLDRERAWREALPHILGSNRYALAGPWHDRPKMPNLVTRDEVEKLRRYAVCAICAPDTDTRCKRHHTDRFTFVTAANLIREHLGRDVLDEHERPLGPLDRWTTTTDATTTLVTVHAGSHELHLQGDDLLRLARRAPTTRQISSD
jgi:hypothetical protein